MLFVPGTSNPYRLPRVSPTGQALDVLVIAGVTGHVSGLVDAGASNSWFFEAGADLGISHQRRSSTADESGVPESSVSSSIGNEAENGD